MAMLLLRLSFASLCVAGFTDAEEDRNPDMYGPTYQFKYHVHDQMTMDYKTHEEVGENGLVRGSYTVREPNGDLRVVSYTAGDSGGFRAMVRVNPTLKPEEENSAHLDGQKEGSDTPLKIQLSTELKGDQLQQRNQRHSITAKFNTTRNPDINSTTSATSKIKMKNLVGSKKPTNIKETFHDTLQSQSFVTTSGIKKPHIKNYKYTAHHTVVLPPKPELTATYVPLHVSSIQGTTHYGQFLTPLLLHVVPARFPRKPEVKFSTALPKEYSSSTTSENIASKISLCRADQVNSNTKSSQSGDEHP